MLVHVKDGRIIKIEGDPDFPTNHGTMCSKGLASCNWYIILIDSNIPSSGLGKRGRQMAAYFLG